MNHQLLSTTRATVAKDASKNICLFPQKRRLKRKGLLMTLFIMVLCTGQSWAQNDKLNYDQGFSGVVLGNSKKTIEFQGQKNVSIRLGSYIYNRNKLYIISPSGVAIDSIPPAKGSAGTDVFVNELTLPENGIYRIQLENFSSSQNTCKFWLYQTDPFPVAPDTLQYNKGYLSSVSACAKNIIVFKGEKNNKIKLNLSYFNRNKLYIIMPSGSLLASIPVASGIVGSSTYILEQTLPEEGIYSICLENFASDENSYTYWIYNLDSTNGISDLTVETNNLVKVFPNPTENSKEFNVVIDNNDSNLQGGSLIVYSISGQIIFKRSGLLPKMKLGGFSRGCYLIEINLTNGKINKKIIVD